MRLELDKERFKGFLEQFIGDAPYQIDLIKTLLGQLPSQVKECLIEELYYDDIYKGEVYKLQHCVFKDDIHYFVNFPSLLEFLKGRNLEASDSYIDAITPQYLSRKIKANEPLLGYYITKEVRE